MTGTFNRRPRAKPWLNVGPRGAILTVSACLGVSIGASPALARDGFNLANLENAIVVRAAGMENPQDKALSDVAAAYGEIGAQLGVPAACDIQHLCLDEQVVVRITPEHVQVLIQPLSQPSVKLASFPVAAIEAVGRNTNWQPRAGTLEASYVHLQRSLSAFDRMAGRPLLYAYPTALDAPFLPWPVRMPSTYEDVTREFVPTGTLGSIASQIANRIAPKGFDTLHYFSVPGGFAIATELERVGRNRPVPEEDRWTRGKRGGAMSLFDYWRSLLEGENDRFRVYVYFVTDADIQHGEQNADESDVAYWKTKGRPALSRERSAAKALPGTRIWLYTYEFTASKSKGAALVANTSDALRMADNRQGSGL